MQRDEALRILIELRPTIVERFGVKRMRLFGSTARNEAREDSDVDVLVEFERPATLKFQRIGGKCTSTCDRQPHVQSLPPIRARRAG